MGDGTDAESLGKFRDAIEYWMVHDAERNTTAQKAIKFVRDRHSVAAFANQMRTAILKKIK